MKDGTDEPVCRADIENRFMDTGVGEEGEGGTMERVTGKHIYYHL